MNLKNLTGIFASLFRIGGPGSSSIQIKNNSGVAEFKDNDDSDLVKARFADPAGATDGVTKGFADTNYGTGSVPQAVQEVEADIDNTDVGTPVNTTFQPSSTTKIRRVRVDVTTAFDATSMAFSVGYAASPESIVAESDGVDLTQVGVYDLDMRKTWGQSSEAIRISATGTGGTTGAANVMIEYVETPKS